MNIDPMRVLKHFADRLDGEAIASASMNIDPMRVLKRVMAQTGIACG